MAPLHYPTTTRAPRAGGRLGKLPLQAASALLLLSASLFADDAEKRATTDDEPQQQQIQPPAPVEEPQLQLLRPQLQPQPQVIRIPLPDVRRPVEADLVTDSKSFAFQMTGVGMFASSAADLGTTEWGLTHSSLYEGNPLATGRPIRVIHHVVGPMAVWWTTERLHRSGHPKMALALRISLMAVYSYAAIHNTRKIYAVTP